MLDGLGLQRRKDWKGGRESGTGPSLVRSRMARMMRNEEMRRRAMKLEVGERIRRKTGVTKWNVGSPFPEDASESQTVVEMSL